MQDEICNARESIQENLLAFLEGMPQETLDKICQTVVEGFAPLLEKRERARKAVSVVQVTNSYRVVKATNIFDLRMGLLPSQEAENLVKQGITVTVSPNK